MGSDDKFYKEISAMHYAFLRRAYDLICRRISPEELKNEEKFLLRANKEFKEAQDLLLEIVIGIEKTLILSKDLVKSKNAKTFLKHHRKIAKRLADCLVWAIIKDKHTVKELSIGEDTGYIFGKSGMQDEFEILDKLNSSKNVFALLNDLTLCLHTGDILKADIGKDSWSILEVKSKGLLEILRNKDKEDLSESRKDEVERFNRQVLKNNLKLFYLKKGIGVDTEKNRFKMSFDSKMDDVFCVNDIESVLSTAMAEGVCIKEVEDGLVYGAYRTGFVKSGYQFLLDKLPKKYKYGSENSLEPLPYLGVNLQAPHLLPVFLLPIDPDLLFKLAFNFCQLYVYIDLPVLIKMIEVKGFDVSLTKKGVGDTRELFVHNNQFLKISKGDRWVLLGQHPLGRVFGEGLSLKSMVNIYTT